MKEKTKQTKIREHATAPWTLTTLTTTATIIALTIIQAKAQGL